MQLAWLSPVGRWATLLLSSLLAKFQGMVRALMVWIISAGPIPSHIAFIMDGNRRFADRLHVDRRIGHTHGYDALLRTLKDCFDLHVKTVTLFAFSIDNFQRSPDEVSALMDLMQSKLETLIEKQGLASEYGIRVQILGDLRLLPQGARLAAEKAMAVTKHNSSVVLNLCISYTSTHEIVQAIQRTRNNFCAAWSVPCKQSGHSVCSKAYCHSQEECHHDFENGNTVRENSCHMQSPYDQPTNFEHSHATNSCNGENVDRILHEDNMVRVNSNGCSRTLDDGSFGVHDISFEDGIVAERKLCTDIPSLSLLTDGAYSIGLRNRNKKKLVVSDGSAVQDLPLHALCSSGGQLGEAACADKVESAGSVMDAVRNGCMQRECVVYETEHEDFHKPQEVVDSRSSDICTYQCLSSPISVRNGWCHLHQSPSSNFCEEKTKVDFSLIDDFNEPLDACNGILKVVEDFVSEEEIEKNLYTHPCPPPDLLIRTSGETRLSNFLLWQTSFSHLAFCKVLWPEFSFRHLVLIILEYQRAYPSLLKKRQYYNSMSRRHY